MQKYIHLIVFLMLVVVGSTRIGKNHIISKDKKIVLFVIILALYGGLRSPLSMVDDYYSDFSLLQRMSFEDILIVYSTREPIYRCFVKVIGMITSNVQWVFIIQSCIVSIGFGLFVKRRSIDPLISFLVFLSLREFSFCLAAMRQGIAIAIVLGIADKYLKERRILPFIVAVVVASLFHTSALLVVGIYPCYYWVKKTKPFIAVVASLAFLLIMFSSILSAIVSRLPFLGKYDSYIQGAYYQSGIPTTLIILTILVLSLVLIFNVKEDDIEKELRCLSVGLGLDFCGIFYGALSRTSFYFTGFSCILFPKALQYFKNYQLARCVLILLLLFQYAVFGPGQGGRDYHFFWTIN